MTVSATAPRAALRPMAAIAAAGLTAALGSGADAAVLLYEYDTEFTGAQEPESATTPWLTALFEDTGPGQVKLTLTADNLVEEEKVSAWAFTLDPALDPSLLTFGSPTVEAGAFDLPAIDQAAADSINVPGGFKLDFAFEPTVDNSAGPAAQFNGGDSLSYLITFSGAGTFNALSFAFATTKNNENLYTAVHVQAIDKVDGQDNNNAGSGWVSADPTIIPTPAAVWAGLALLTSLGLKRTGRHGEDA